MTAVEITSLSLTAIGLAFAAGLLSFVSPCVLPLLPVYLSFISGVGVEDLGREHRRLLGTSLLFVAGFTVVFMLMGAGAGGIGRLLIEYRDVLMIVAGAFIAFSGLVVAGVIKLPEPVLRVAPKRAGAGGAFLTGAALAIGWTPCVGYVLGAILSMAATSQSARLRVAAPPRLLHRARRAVRARRAGVRLGERQAGLGQAALPRHPGRRRRAARRVRRAHDVRRPAAALALDAGRQPGRALSPGPRARPAPARRGAVS